VGRIKKKSNSKQKQIAGSERDCDMYIIKNLSWEFAGGMFLIFLLWVVILGLPLMAVVIYENRKTMDEKSEKKDERME
jgi:hypothetical protein